MFKLRNSILIIILIIGILTFAWPGPLSAQSNDSPVEFNNVTVWLYPEYDDPRLLVMLEGKYSGYVSPVEVNFLVPSAAEMYSAGSMNDQGVYSGGPPERKTSDIAGWDEITYVLQSNTFRVEYYDPIIVGYPDKNISYDFRSLSTINNLNFVVQVPSRSSGFNVTPAGTQNTENGFTVYTYNYSQYETGQTVHFDISYTRTDTNPSFSDEAPQASTPESNNAMLIVLVFGIVIAVVLISWFIVRNKKRKPVKSYASRKGQNPDSRTSSVKTYYCNQCGHPIKILAKYCPNCGHKLEK